MTTLVYDQRWNGVNFPEVLRQYLREIDHFIAVKPTCRLSEVEQLSKMLQGTSKIIVLGGGGVIDKVKLANYDRRIPIRRYVSSGRAGIATLTRQSQLAHVVAIPTTLGTGSEANAKAVLEITPNRRRLIFGESLFPASYKHIPEMYATLSKQQVMYGILEVFFRSAGAYVVMQDVDALVFFGFVKESVALARQAYADPEPQINLTFIAKIAQLSAATHKVEIHKNQTLWVWPLWYLANELSSVSEITKLEATIALVNSVMTRIGTFGYGYPSRIAEIEELLAMPIQEFVSHMAGRLSPEAQRRITNVDLDRLVNQTFRQWVGGQLALGMAQRQELHNIFMEVKERYA